MHTNRIHQYHHQLQFVQDVVLYFDISLDADVFCTGLFTGTPSVTPGST